MLKYAVMRIQIRGWTTEKLRFDCWQKLKVLSSRSVYVDSRTHTPSCPVSIEGNFLLAKLLWHKARHSVASNAGLISPYVFIT